MIRTLVLVLIGGLAAVTVAMVVFLSNSDEEKAEADLKTYRWCDTVVEAPPGTVTVDYTPEGSLYNEAGAVVSNEAGAVVSVGDTAIDGIVDGLLSNQQAVTVGEATVRLEPLHRETAPWPYTDSGDAPVADEYDMTFRWPDSASGVWVTTGVADSIFLGTLAAGETPDPDQLSSSYIRFYSCNSLMIVGKGGSNMDGVAPEDKAAYERLAAEVTIK